mgnify:FL=1
MARKDRSDMKTKPTPVKPNPIKDQIPTEQLRREIKNESICPLGEEQACPYEPLLLSCDDCYADRILSFIKSDKDFIAELAKENGYVKLADNSDIIDIPDEVFFSQEAKRCGFTKRSFLEAGWRKVELEK